MAKISEPEFVAVGILFFPLLFLGLLLLIDRDDAYCQQILLRNRYATLADCIKANPGIKLTSCGYDDSPLEGKIVGPLYANPLCEVKPKTEMSEIRNNYNLPSTLPLLAVAVEPMRRCGAGQGRSRPYVSAYICKGEMYPNTRTQVKAR